jgi:hypothetical protein
MKLSPAMGSRFGGHTWSRGGAPSTSATKWWAGGITVSGGGAGASDAWKGVGAGQTTSGATLLHSYGERSRMNGEEVEEEEESIGAE